MIIGITGGTGCGKTTALRAIALLGGTVIDCDAVYHGLLQTDGALLAAIENRFPGTVEGGQLRRKKLGAIVFSDAGALADLNRITHGAVKAKVRQLLAGQSFAAIDAFELFDGGLSELCDVTVGITAPMDARVARLQARDNISREYALLRIRAQKGEDYFRQHCDYILENTGTQQAFQEKCLAFFRELTIIRLE